jgi:hypothetical protein
MRLLGVLVVFAGCHGGGMATPDAGAGSGSSDASSGRLGLFVAWEMNPSLPGALSDSIMVSDVELQLRNFQLVGDAGNATRSKYLLTWNDVTEPLEDTFPDAPAGVYSKVAIDMGSTGLATYTYQILGMWRGDPQVPATPFKIEDHSPLTILLPCDRTLTAAGSSEVAVRIDLRAAVSSIAFNKLDSSDGVLVLDDGNPDELDDFRQRLQDAFRIEN